MWDPFVCLVGGWAHKQQAPSVVWDPSGRYGWVGPKATSVGVLQI